MYTIKSVGAECGSECHLLLMEQGALLLETGCSFSAPQAVENIKKELNGKPLLGILLTHSHFDHAGGSAVIHQAFPNAPVVASEKTASILQKPNARKLICELDADCAKERGWQPGPDTTDGLHVDIATRDGEVVELGGIHIRTLYTPGHTNCSVCFYIEEEDLLVVCETLGMVANYPQVQPCFVVGYQPAKESIEKMRALHAKHITTVHHGPIPDEDVEAFFDKSAAAADAAKDLILAEYKKGKDLDAIVEACRCAFHEGSCDRIQPTSAYYANANVMVPRTLAEFGYTLDEQDK